MDAEKFRFRHWVLMCRVSIRCNERSLLALKSIGKLANIVAIWLETLQTISLIEIMKALEKLSRKSCRSYGDDYIGMIQIHVGRTSGDKKEQKWAIFSSMGRAKIWEAGKVTDIGASKQSQNPKWLEFDPHLFTLAIIHCQSLWLDSKSQNLLGK